MHLDSPDKSHIAPDPVDILDTGGLEQIWIVMLGIPNLMIPCTQDNALYVVVI
jgi:hypothetical protein